MNKLLYVILIIVHMFSCTINVQAQNEQVTIQRILYFYKLKNHLADKSWPGFGLPQYDVDLAYFTRDSTFVIDASGLLGKKKPLIKIYDKNRFKIERTERLDTVGFHMATAYEDQDTSILWYHNPVMLCSDYETTRSFVKDVPDLQTWATMVMHEYFHGFQFRHPAFIRFANDSITISNSKLQSYYDDYSWFRESIERENSLLLKCLEANDIALIKKLFKNYQVQRSSRLSKFKTLKGFDLSVQEEFLEKMEGSARYMEYQLYLSFAKQPLNEKLINTDTAYKPLALRNFSLKKKPWMYESNSIRYFYSTGFNLLRLLDKLNVVYKRQLFDSNDLTPFQLLSRRLTNR